MDPDISQTCLQGSLPCISAGGLREPLVRLAMTDLMQGRWTEAIHDEWIR